MSNENYKINIDREPISSEEIAARQDFSQILKGAQAAPAAKPFFKTAWFLGSATVTALAAIGLLLYLQLSPAADMPQPPIAEKPTVTAEAKPDLPVVEESVIRPAFENLDVSTRNFEVEPSQAQVLSYPTGSQIVVPANAFLDEQGQPVKGKVDVEYREFHDPIEFMASGIPMTYDSAGVTYQFESAGMIEINAFQNGKPVFVNPENPIQVEMVSHRKGDHFNLYKLDPVKGDWESRGHDRIQVKAVPVLVTESKPSKNTADAIQESDELPTKFQPISYPKGMQEPGSIQDQSFASVESDQTLNAIDNKIEIAVADSARAQMRVEEVKATDPIKPEKADPNRYNFDLKVSANEFPELALIEDTRFEIRDPKTDFTSRYYETIWEDVKLEDNQTGVNYRITLTKGTKVVSYVVFPVYDEENFEKAMAAFQTKFNAYTNELGVRMEKLRVANERLAQLREDYQAKAAEITALREQYMEQQRELRKQQQKRLQAERSWANTEVNANNLIRVFQIDGFGIWNCDSPYLGQEPVQLSLAFRHQGKKLEPNSVFYVDVSRNNVVMLSPKPYKDFTADAATESLLILVLPGDRVAYVDRQRFAEIAQKVLRQEVEVTMPEVQFASVDALKEHLEIGIPRLASLN